MYSAVRSYFRTHLAALGFEEWKDAFNVENIPKSRMDRAFHLGPVGGSRRDAFDPNSQDLEASLTVRVWRKGYRDPASAIDQCLVDLDAILARTLDIANRSGPVVKNVYYDGHEVVPLDATNDNVAVLEIRFRCFIILCV